MNLSHMLFFLLKLDQKFNMVKLPLESLLKDTVIIDEFDESEVKIEWTLSSGLKISNSKDYYPIMNFYSLSSSIIAVLWPFSVLFSNSSWLTSVELLLGAILCRGDRTVTGILRATGLSKHKGFSKYHRILNSLDWSPKRGSEILLKMLLKMVGKERPVISSGKDFCKSIMKLV